jgi:putative DNA primase/helicase
LGIPGEYQIGGLLSGVRAGAKLESLTEDSLRHIIAEVCDFDEIRLNHKHMDTHRILPPPCEILKSILTMDLDERKFPPLEVVASTPILGSDGKIINRPGYHRKDQLFLAPTIEIPPVPKRPTKQDVDQALALILGHYLEGFPIADDASKCHALSVVLTPLVRRLVKGPTSLHLALASTPGTGKSLLMAALSQIVTGRPVEPSMLRESEDEMTKTLLAVLLAGPPYVLFDNINSADSATLAAAIASPDCTFSGRLLGSTKHITVPALACWLATGNNPKVSRELARRTVVIRLDANQERPELRTDFKIKSLLRWGIEHRADLLYAALVLCRAWVAAGQPKGRSVLGSFESWAEVIGGILDVIGMPGFLENKDELMTRDDHARGWSALVAEWWRVYQSNLVSIDDLHRSIVSNPELEVAFSETLGQGLDRSQKRRLGMELRKVQDRVFGSWRIEVSTSVVRGFPLFQLVPLSRAPARTRESEAQPQSAPACPAPARTRECPGQARPNTEQGCPPAPARTREPDTSPGAAWERHNTRERPDQTQPHNGPASPAPARTREPGGDDESPRPGAACEEQSTLPF